MGEPPFSAEPLHEGLHYPSPFTKVLALGYYDGPTEGLVQEGSSDRVYQFHMLAWDDESQDLRIFALAPLPSSTLAQLTEAYAPYEEPRWPVWVPSWHAEMEPVTQQLLAQAGPPEWVLASQDLLAEILAAKAVTPELVARVTDWASFLGLGRQAAFRPGRDLSGLEE